jgi:alpha-tubulin suppressor-like RCC1 family protein
MSMRYPAGGFLTAIYRAELAPNSPLITSTSAGILTATISFTAPATGPTPTSYIAVSSPGNITATATSSPITVSGLTGGQAYTFTVYAVNSYNNSAGATSSSVTPASGATFYVYGSGQYGALGLGNTTNYSSPKQLGLASQWLKIASGYKAAMGVRTNGGLWSWGLNNSGQLGLGNTTYYSSPKQVGALTSWTSISMSVNHVLAVRSNGTLWSWGSNSSGGLGLGNTTDYSSPKQVGALTNWSIVSCGYGNTSYAVKTDGTLWSWGRGTQGQLGLSTTTSYSSPKQVGSDTNWSFVSGAYNSVIALKTNGTLWSWGQNDVGQLGLSSATTYFSSPMQIGALANWAGISTSRANSGGYTTFLANKSDGTLWAWGSNSYGQCAQGTSGTNFSSPVQVGSLTNWTNNVGVSVLVVNAVKSNGTLWSWGADFYGTLGSPTARSSPVQVGALTTWLLTTAGSYSVYSATS